MAAFLPVAIPISHPSTRKQSVAYSSASFDLLHLQRLSIRSLSFPSSSSKWSAVSALSRCGSVVVCCSSSSSPKNASRPFTRLFVSGLSFRTTEESLKSAFQHFGELMEVNLVMDRIANRPRGFAFLRYATEEESKKAIEGMHGKSKTLLSDAVTTHMSLFHARPLFPSPPLISSNTAIAADLVQHHCDRLDLPPSVPSTPFLYDFYNFI